MLERGALPFGASTRNAGFACYGSASEILSDLEAEGPEAAARAGGRALGGAEAPAPAPGRRGAAATRATAATTCWARASRTCWTGSAELNALLRPVLGGDAFEPAPRDLARFGFPREHVHALVRNPWEGQIHSGRMLRALLGRAQRLGAVVLHGVEVTALEDGPRAAAVHVAAPSHGGSLAFRAAQAAVCTAAFTRRLLPRLDVVPGRGQILVTVPVPGHPLRGTFHRDGGDLYFRDLGDRVLLGGGRHTDVAGETTEAMDTTPAIQAGLERFLREVVLPGRGAAVDLRWAGIMDFGATRAPVLERLSAHLCVGVRTSGMGVAIGTRLGDRLADLVRAGL